jgi:uncharacterized protein DUF4386
MDCKSLAESQCQDNWGCLSALLSHRNFRFAPRWLAAVESHRQPDLNRALYRIALLLYYLFKPVNKSLSLLAALFSLAGCAITALSFIDRAPSNISPLAFFGPFCLLIGYLILRSTFLPRILAVLMALAGLGWLTFLTPLANYLALYSKVLGFVAELSLML